ncbi:MAG: FtsW/RodA/SpoVE family cell cycle protein [Eggerthella lenta]
MFLCFRARARFVTAARAKSDVSSFVAVGLTSMIVLQAFIIVGGVTRLIPLTGLTLPFISQGGSSLLASFIIVGFLLRCGARARAWVRRWPAPPPRCTPTAYWAACRWASA